MKKTVFFTVFFSLLLFSQSIFASTDWVTRVYSVLEGDIKLVVNDIQVETNVEPFLLKDQGLAMVSLRDLEEALGFTAHWDEANRTIKINSHHAPSNSFLHWDSFNKIYIEDLKVIRNVGPFYKSRTNDFYIAGRPFSNGVAVELTEGKTVEFVLDLYKQFRTFQGYFGVEDETMNSFGGYTMEIYGDDRELFVSEVIKPSDYPRYIPPGEFDLANVNRLTIRIHWEEIGVGDYENVTAVLANFIFYEK